MKPYKHNNRYLPHVTQEVYQRYIQGESVYSLAEEYGCDKSIIYSMAYSYAKSNNLEIKRSWHWKEWWKGVRRTFNPNNTPALEKNIANSMNKPGFQDEFDSELAAIQVRKSIQRSKEIEQDETELTKKEIVYLVLVVIAIGIIIFNANILLWVDTI